MSGATEKQERCRGTTLGALMEEFLIDLVLPGTFL